MLLQCTISAMTTLSIALESVFDRAALVSGALFLYSSTTNGFIVPTSQIPRGLRWLKPLSFHWVAYQTWSSLEFTDRRFDCPFQLSPGNNSNPTELWDPIRCAPREGNTILMDQLEGKPHAYPDRVMYFAALYCAYLLLAWLVLTFLLKKDTIARPRKSSLEMFLPITRLFHNRSSKASRLLGKKTENQIASDEQEKEPSETVELEVQVDISSHGQPLQTPPVTIRVLKLSLSVVKQAILGGSGSGKTTFLNSLLRRTQPSIQVSGDIYFNGTENPSMGQINTVSGYVRQGEGLLMSHLTMRETLNFAAELGMSQSLSATQKRARVEEVNELMGLQECADVRIGNNEKSGCSGGQRRRVSIGMQLINEPACLFLDEPTTGFDALTALSIVQILKSLAISGRTIVCTIHQPEVGIWDEFDDVLLLVKGGRLAVLTRRMSKNATRQRGTYINLILEPVFIVIVTALFYWDLEDTPTGLLNRIGLFQQLMGCTLAGLIVHTEVFPKEREIAFREMSNGSYGATSFLVSYMINELPLTPLSACLSLMAIITMTGLRATMTTVPVLILAIFGYSAMGESFGIAYSSYFVSNAGLGVTLMNFTII
ncbi:hypothetical protein BGX33_005289 [Mortierella sp. NVP41]|nr:hypothetical protein BGX33_005289 [Mortierella sp. NVP41]